MPPDNQESDDQETDLFESGGAVPRATDGPDSPETLAGPSPPSDVGLASDQAADATLPAPSFPAPVESTPREFRLQAGDRIGDFEILETLGQGAFGVVYLARQLSLDRRVALKIAANQGSEGRTMARLEHDYIVQVFSEAVDDTGQFRLLCMQLVAGASLERIIRALRELSQKQGGWAGADYLTTIDERAAVSDVFDPSALRDRELLEEASDVEATAWVGARLAEAIDFAHANGVLHRDIKPANVLINQYGRPLLADFNIAFRAIEPTAATTDSQEASTFGGTLAFMAPEHLEAFDPASEMSPEDVDEQSDIYSLGIVVFELLTGRAPFAQLKRGKSRRLYVDKLARQRREAPAPIDPGPPTARKVLQHTLARSLAPDKHDRFESGGQFAAALDGCRRLASADRQTPTAGAFARSVIRRPLGWAILLIFLPQVIGSVVNIAYNQYEIVQLLNEDQRRLFGRLVMGYNAVVYPAALATLGYFFLPVFRMWRAMQGTERLDAERVDRVRRATLRLPLWVLAAAAVGWLPGGVLFPLVLRVLEPPISGDVFLHFITSFTLSGLVAVAYSFCAMQYIVLRVLYPRLWTDATDFRATARRELAGCAWRFRFIEAAAYAIPLVAVVLLAIATTDAGGIPLRTLILSLALLGGAGVAVVRVATGVMAKVQVALTGGG